MIETNEKQYLNTEKGEIQMDEVQKSNNMDEVVRECKNKSQEEVKQELEKFGVKMIGKSKASLTPIIPGQAYLVVEVLWDKAVGRKYHFDEVIEGKSMCIDTPANYMDPDNFSGSRVSAKLEKFLSYRFGKYEKWKIQGALRLIEEYRILQADRKNCINAEVYTTQEIMKKMQEYMINNPLDNRIAMVNNKDEKLLGIVGNKENTAYQNFQKLIKEIAPENEVKMVKDGLRRAGGFVTDNNELCYDCQKTISLIEREKHNIRGDKMYAFCFEKEFLEKFEKEYEEALKRKMEKEKQEKKEEKNHE